VLIAEANVTVVAKGGEMFSIMYAASRISNNLSSVAPCTPSISTTVLIPSCFLARLRLVPATLRPILAHFCLIHLRRSHGISTSGCLGLSRGVSLHCLKPFAPTKIACESGWNVAWLCSPRGNAWTSENLGIGVRGIVRHERSSRGMQV